MAEIGYVERRWTRSEFENYKQDMLRVLREYKDEGTKTKYLRSFYIPDYLRKSLREFCKDIPDYCSQYMALPDKPVPIDIWIEFFTNAEERIEGEFSNG